MSRPSTEEVHHAAERMLEHFGNCDTRQRSNMLGAYFDWHESYAYYNNITKAVEAECENEVEYYEQHKQL